MKRKPPLEKDIQRTILEWLGYQRRCFVWRNNTGGFKTAENHFYRYGMNGSADIIGVINGKFLAVEVKRPKGKVSDAQQQFLDSVIRCGGVAFVATSVDDVEKHLKESGVI